MTENKRYDMGRFHWDRALEKIIDYETCESYYGDECVEILNDINYQNFKLEKENEELKSKYSEQCIQLDFLKDENQHMRKVLGENKELKQENEKLKQSYNIFCGKINNSISRLYRNRSITFDERAFYLRKVRELKEEIFE